MNWRLTNDAINGPKLQDWSDWRIMDAGRKLTILDMIYDDLVKAEQDQGVIRIAPGIYMVQGDGWF